MSSEKAARHRRGRWEVDIANALYSAIVAVRPLYDPDKARVQG